MTRYWNAQPNAGAQTRGTRYCARPTAEGLVEVRAQQQGVGPWRLFMVAPPEHVDGYMSERVARGWFTEIPQRTDSEKLEDFSV